MKVEEIERLLTEFYEGNTTESQEDVLKDYFRTENVPEHLQKDKEYFLTFFCQQAIAGSDVSVGLEKQLSCLIDAKAEEEQYFFRRNKSKRNWRWVGGVAATMLLLIGIGYGIWNIEDNMYPPTPQDTFSDPQIAYAVLQATLVEVSTNLNKGIEQVQETQKDVTRVNKEVIKEIQK